MIWRNVSVSGDILVIVDDMVWWPNCCFDNLCKEELISPHLRKSCILKSQFLQLLHKTVFSSTLLTWNQLFAVYLSADVPAYHPHLNLEKHNRPWNMNNSDRFPHFLQLLEKELSNSFFLHCGLNCCWNVHMDEELRLCFELSKWALFYAAWLENQFWILPIYAPAIENIFDMLWKLSELSDPLIHRPFASVDGWRLWPGGADGCKQLRILPPLICFLLVMWRQHHREQ